jgi:tetratricopeptide (TPR) repeat protein
MIRPARRLAALTLAAVLLPGCKTKTDPASVARTAAPVPLYTDLGSHHHPVTASAEAQQYFDQGLRLTYAFNHDEAVASFRQGARLDPKCAMCWWGVALALGPNINLPMDAKIEPEAWAAVQKAVRLSDKVTQEERDYISALARRYADKPEQRPALDIAYADAMGALAAKYPEDLDAATLYAEALMDLQPWNYWTVGGEPKGAIEQIIATLEAVLAKDPNNPGACHYYIHAVEASLEPERALPCADRLAQLMPGAGHIVHMPAHVYMRVGRYDLAVEHNQHAAHEDLGFIERRHPAGMYPLIYTAHNYHFLWAALSMQGRADEAIQAAREVIKRAPAEAVRKFPPLEYYSPTPYLALARFQRWNELLEEPPPPAEQVYTTGFYHYTRGLAFLGTGRPVEAKAEREKLAGIAEAMPPDQMANLNSMKTLLEIALRHLDAELAQRQGKTDVALKELREAVALEDGLTYDEPPPWYHPMRHVLGNALLAAGRAREAEEVFRADLKRNRENGWSLHGLALALAKQGKVKDAAAITTRFKEAWAEADYRL